MSLSFAGLLLQIEKVPCKDRTLYVILPTRFSMSQEFNEIFSGVSTFLRIVVPVIGTVCTTVLLVVFIQRRKLQAPSSNREEKHRKQMDDLTVCLIAVSVSFLCLVLPFSVVSILFYTSPTSCSFFTTFYVIVSLTITNSSVNFFIYHWKLQPFRKAVRRMFRKEVATSVVTSSDTSMSRARSTPDVSGHM